MDMDDNRFEALLADRPIDPKRQAGAWCDYEPNYDAYIAELESQQEHMADVATYDDWFPDNEEQAPICVNAHDRC